MWQVREEFRKIFLQMGFEEMPTNNFVESSFWNFDTLIQPQQVATFPPSPFLLCTWLLPLALLCAPAAAAATEAGMPGSGWRRQPHA